MRAVRRNYETAILAVLKGDVHMAIKKCKECGKDVGASAKVCPHCGKKYPSGGLTMPAKIFLAIVLLVILGKFLGTPENSQKLNTASSSPPRSTETSKEKAMRAIKLDFKWSKSGFDNVMMADFTIINPSDYTIKDIEITCTHYAKSGTKIDSNTRTIYDVVPAKGKKIFKDFNMGFIHSQAQSSACECTDLIVAQ